MTIRAILVDDEPLSRARVRMFLGDYDDVAVVGEAGDGEEALRIAGGYRPDVMFVDVQMPDFSGVELARRIPPDERPLIVFVTAFSDYAVEAFGLGAIHYLVKPFGPDEVRDAVVRLRQEMARRTADGAVSRLITHLQNQREDYLQRVLVKRGGRALLLRVDQLDWIEAAGNYTRLHTRGVAHLLRQTLQSLEQKLDPRQFVRVHRSTVVNLDRVRELQPTSHGDYAVILHDDTRLPLSRSYRERLELLLGHL